MYTKHIAAMATEGYINLPEGYKEIYRQSVLHKTASKHARIPRFIQQLNQQSQRVICDQQKLYIGDPQNPTLQEREAILATHTGNTSVYSFAAEVEYHAKYLFALAKIKLPFFGKSVYDSAIRADMTVGDTEFEGPAPFYQENSRIVKRQIALHSQNLFHKE